MFGAHLIYHCLVIGERKRANLVVQLARFYLSVCRHTVMFYVILNTRQRNFTYTVSRACTNILLRSYGSYVLQLAGLRVVGGRLVLYSCSQLCMLLACIYNLYCNHQVLAQLLHHFLPYISWIAPARQQCSTFVSYMWH